MSVETRSSQATAGDTPQDRPDRTRTGQGVKNGQDPAARLVIADPGLSGLGGHHFGYSLSLARAARDRGVPVLLLAARGFDAAATADGVEVRPWFRTRYQTQGGGGLPRRALYAVASRLSPGAGEQMAERLRGLRRGLRTAGMGGDGFGDELAAALRHYPHAGPDIVLAHSVSAANIESLAGAETPPSVLALHIVLRRTRAEMDRDDRGSEGIVPILTRVAARLGARLRLHADTPELVTEFASATGQAVSEVSLPITMPPIRSGPIGSPPRVVFPGGARREKGYGLLPGLVRELRHRTEFVIHSGVVDSASDPAVQRAHRALLAMAGENLTVIERDLETGPYARMLSGADLILLPYDAAAYAARSSGILAEALALGVPAVVPAGGWMEERVANGRGIAFSSWDGMSTAVDAALLSLPRLTAAARAGAAAWRERHSPETLLTEVIMR